MALTPISLLQKIGTKIYQRECAICCWKDSPLETLNKLKNDCSGKAGELLIKKLCSKTNISYHYDGDTFSKDGTYDILINDKKVEVKTAKIGKHKGFQHENLRLSGYDYLLFLDICPSYYYITILPHFDLTQKSEIIGRKPHLRKGTTDVYKLIDKGHTIKIMDTTPLEVVSNFLTTQIAS